MRGDKRVALVIGCADYRIGPALSNPVRDAGALTQCFHRLGFVPITLVENPNLLELGRQLADFSVVAEDAEVAVIYFAGHGIEAGGYNYLIPIDAELNHARRLDFEAVKLGDIMRAVDDERRHLRLIILDACRNNPYRARMRGLEAVRSVDSGLGYVEPRGNMLVAYAAEHGRTALDGDWGGNSPYASALLAHLETPGLEIRLLFGRVRDEVYRRTKENQSPHLYGTLGGQEIYLKPKLNISVSRSEQATPPDLPIPRNGFAERAAQLWQEFDIGGTADPELIQAFMAQIENESPAPLWAYKARKRLDELENELRARENAHWRSAELENTAEKYQAYLDLWPSGAYADRARLQIDEIAEEAEWTEASASADTGFIEAFMLRYPKSPRVPQARRRILELAEEKEWKVVQPAEDVGMFSAFLERYPQGKHSAEAQKRLRSLERRQFADKGFVKIEAVDNSGVRKNDWIVPGSGIGFRDIVGGPEMVVVPAGGFMMGSTAEEIAALIEAYGGDYFEREGPRHRVTIRRPFAIGVFAVTRGEFGHFVDATGYQVQGGGHRWVDGNWTLDPSTSWRLPGFQQDDEHPVVCLNWYDAEAFVSWLSKETRKVYRLPNEAEWEHAARAGTATPYWWGSSITPEQANYDCNCTLAGGPKGEYRQRTVPVKSFEPNPWGIYQAHGNVWEWCKDDWHDNYANIPDGLKAKGAAWTTGGAGRVLRGGSWSTGPGRVRSAIRYWSAAHVRNVNFGFRVARSL